MPQETFDASKYPNAEAAFPGAAAAIHDLGGPKEADALKALDSVGKGLAQIDGSGKVTEKGVAEVNQGNKDLYPALNEDIKAAASQEGGATQLQKKALMTLGGIEAVAGMAIVEKGVALSKDADPDMQAVGAKKITDASKTIDGAIFTKQSDAFVAAHPSAFHSENKAPALQHVDTQEIAANIAPKTNMGRDAGGMSPV